MKPSLVSDRRFTDSEAKRDRVPLWIGLFGAAGSGKTYSGLRLATGIQRVFPGPIVGIDTECGRLLHYSPEFKFRYIPFEPPFGPADYLAAVEHAMTLNPSVILVDSASHVWSGVGGVLSMAEATNRKDAGKWAKPKGDHEKLIEALKQLRTNFVFCFRAKPKIKMIPGKEPEHLGYQPIGSDELVFEMTLNCLLPPGSDGIPEWRPEFHGEKAMLKLPVQFRAMFSTNPPPQLTEDVGEQLARWASGATIGQPAAKTSKASGLAEVASLMDEYHECKDEETFKALEAKRKVLWDAHPSGGARERLKNASNEAAARLQREA